MKLKIFNKATFLFIVLMLIFMQVNFDVIAFDNTEEVQLEQGDCDACCEEVQSLELGIIQELEPVMAMSSASIYFSMDYGFNVGSQISASAALTQFSNGGNVWCSSQSAAQALANASYGASVQHYHGPGANQYNHYHGTVGGVQQGGHACYGMGG